MALARGLVALTDLPSFDTSAMDGWAVAGSGPWRLTGRRLLAGQGAAEPLLQGCAVGIATGAVLPPGATANFSAFSPASWGSNDPIGSNAACTDVLGNSQSIGDAILKAKQATQDRDVRRTFILFGDPTLKLH